MARKIVIPFLTFGCLLVIFYFMPLHSLEGEQELGASALSKVKESKSITTARNNFTKTNGSSEKREYSTQDSTNNQQEILDSLSYLKKEVEELNIRLQKIESPIEPIMLTEDNVLGLFDTSQSRQDYTLAEENFYNQSIDLEWDAEMTMSLSNMETGLAAYANDSINITSQECRSDSCRVVISAEEGGPPLYPVMLAAKGASKMLFDSIVEDGVEKTVVIYQR